MQLEVRNYSDSTADQTTEFDTIRPARTIQYVTTFASRRYAASHLFGKLPTGQVSLWNLLFLVSHDFQISGKPLVDSQGRWGITRWCLGVPKRCARSGFFENFHCAFFH
jgi:hypothetical protein